MEHLQEVMQKTLLPVADKLSGNRVLRAISAGFSMLLPVIMVGAIASLLAGLNIQPYQDFISSNGLKEIFTFVGTYTTNMLALYAAYAIGRSMAEELELEKQASIIGITTLFVFLLIKPTGATQDGVTIANVIDLTYFGSAGLFTAMILGCVVPAIYNVFVKNNITIKMPNGVPPFIERSFAGIIPVVCIAALFVVVRQLCLLTPYGTLDGMIYGILRAPLGALSESPLTFGLLCFLCNLLWFFGIHGGMVTQPFLSMLYLTPALENMEALAAGAAMPNVLTNTWWFTFVQVGGSGGIIGLTVLMSFFAKSARYKSLGRMSIIPAICGISEPIVFGTPLMLNVLMFVPMIFAPLLSFVLSYAATVVGIVPVLNGLQLSTGTPVIMSGFLTGGWVAALWQVAIVVLQLVIYLPFFKMMDKQAYEEETAAETAAEEA